MDEDRLLLGLYCGEALDGVDAALLRVTGRGGAMAGEVLAERVLPLDDACVRRAELLRGESGQTQRSAQWAKLQAECERSIVQSVVEAGRTLLADVDLPAGRIEAAGWSGLTLRVEPPGSPQGPGWAMRVGSPAAVARRLGLATVGEFLEADLAAGGCGSPLAAWCDWHGLRDERLSRVAVHLGGVARVVFVPASADPSDVLGHDAGPGTLVLDALARKFHHRLCDTDGAIAAGGSVCNAMLHELLAAPYFQAAPPKRTHPGDWSEGYLWRVLRQAENLRCDPPDLMATVTELTARAVADAVAGFTERPHEIILSGGGALNIHLAGRIRSLLSPSSTYTAERYGLGLRSKQAAGMALLAAARLDRHPAHCHHATGADRPAVLGGLYAKPD